MTQATTDAGITRISVPAEFIRSFSNPHNSDIRFIHCYVKIAEFPHGKLPDDINPRSHDELRLNSGIPKRIAESLEDSPELFHIFNRGVLVVAKRASYDNNKRILTFEIPSRDEGGLADGATTDRVIAGMLGKLSEEDKKRILETDSPHFYKDAYVHVEVVSGIPPDMIVPLTAARNTSKQVQEFALEQLRGGYDKLRKVLDASEFGDRIRYRENDPQTVDIRTVLGLLTLFHPKWDAEKREPLVAYRSKGGVLENFQDPDWKDGYEALFPFAVDILELHNYLHENFEVQYRKAFNGGRLGALREVVYKGGADVTSHPLLGHKVKYGLPDGWVYPMLASFRGLLDVYGIGGKKPGWIREPKRFFDEFGDRLVEALVDFSKSQGSNAQTTGKQRLIWNTLRLIVDANK